MTKLAIMNGVSKTFNKVSFSLKKHSPEILVVAGVVGTIASAVLACKATTKISTILDQSKEDIDKIHDCMADEGLKDEYTKQDGQKDLVIVYTQTAVKLAKLYAPSILLGALSITSILASNNVLRKRNVALAAAYATIDKGFKEYRSRVIERFGAEVDRELKYNIKAKKIEETIIDEDGKEKKVKTNIGVADPNALTDYQFFFDADNDNWEKNADYNRMFLLAQQQHANDRLKAQGFLFLNDVLYDLGIDKTKAGQIVGWVYNPDRPNGDNYVDFGISEAYREQEREFVKNRIAEGESLTTPVKYDNEKYERVVILDFNVDGDIWSLMKK